MISLRGCGAAILGGLLAAISVPAQGVQMTNEAGGIACYQAQDLIEAHGAIGFYEFGKVQGLIAQDRCFIMQPHWKVRITEEQLIRGVNAKMLKVRLDNQGRDMRIAWTLAKNFAAWQ